MADESSKRPEKGRRGFLKAASGTAMAAGLVGGYGAFAAIAGRFLYPPSGSDRRWQFVTEETSLSVGDSIRIEASDAAFLPDLEAWARMSGNEIVEAVDGDTKEAVVRRVK